MDFILPQSMFDVVGLHGFRPLVLEMVDFTGNLSAVIEVKSLVNFGVASFSQQSENQVSLGAAVSLLVLENLGLISDSGVAKFGGVFFPQSF